VPDSQNLDGTKSGRHRRRPQSLIAPRAKSG
jgi:hypothetical protein